MRQGEPAFVDSGAWIALALSRDPLHVRAREHWDILQEAGARLHTSIPVVIETFTFLERNASRDVGLAWKNAIHQPGVVAVLPCDLGDLANAWQYFQRKDLHRLSAVDATSFAVMKRAKIHLAFTFDHHFAAVGFRMVG